MHINNILMKTPRINEKYKYSYKKNDRKMQLKELIYKPVVNG